MVVAAWVDGRVSVDESVASPNLVTGRRLHDGFLARISTLTCGLVRARGDILALGPLELLRFGTPKVARNSVEWPIEGGVLAGAPGGSWRIAATGGRLIASIEGYRPALPRPLYSVTQLVVHGLLMRLFLLEMRGRDPAPGITASSSQRLRAASVDVALCATLAGVVRRPPRLGTLLGIAAVYHVACWSTGGRTLGGMVTGQRVVALDGSRLSVAQSIVRLGAAPISWIRGKPVHDEIAGTEVVRD